MTPEAHQLVLDNVDLVRKVATRLARNLPCFIEMEEIVAAGNLGLCQAAIRFDPKLHASFRVWAMIRIRGAIIDQYRGRNYPRLMEQLSACWENPNVEPDRDVHMGIASHSRMVPQILIDKSPSPLEVMIEQEETIVVCISAGRARKQLERTEGRAVDLHIGGKSMREIGKAHGRSGTWSHYTVHKALVKMRQLLSDKGEDAA